MAERTVLPDPADPGGEALREDDVAEQLSSLLGDLVDRSVLVATIEVAEEVGAVAAVELEQAWCLGRRAQHIAQALVVVESAGRQERVALDDVGGDQRVLQVERGEVAIR